jgi:hypothetical protein
MNELLYKHLLCVLSVNTCLLDSGNVKNISVNSIFHDLIIFLSVILKCPYMSVRQMDALEMLNINGCCDTSGNSLEISWSIQWLTV